MALELLLGLLANLTVMGSLEPSAVEGYKSFAFSVTRNRDE
jgi:hypothetical protein